MQSIPIGLRGRDIIGIAETGSGKTGAFLLPIICACLDMGTLYGSSNRRSGHDDDDEREGSLTNRSSGFVRKHNADRTLCGTEGPIAIVLAPTRDLAIQIEQDCINLTKDFTDIRTCCVVGGRSMDEQTTILQQGVDIVIATPLRLVDALMNRYVVLHQTAFVVLDEADRMIDMGFGPQVEAVLDFVGGTEAGAHGTDGSLRGGVMELIKRKQNQIKEKAQQEQLAILGAAAAGSAAGLTSKPPADESISPASSDLEKKKKKTSTMKDVTFTMFSATMPAEVLRLAKQYLKQPVQIQIGDPDSVRNRRIKQVNMMLPSENSKQGKLASTLKQWLGKSSMPIIVFMNTKRKIDQISNRLRDQGIRGVVLHSSINQARREENLARLKNGAVSVLYATDVAGRGLDIKNVQLVINYDLPDNKDKKGIDRYCHRIGRTGRAGREGTAINFILEENSNIFADLVKYLRSTNTPIPPELARHKEVVGNVL
eukprot:g2676.t1